MHANIKAVVCQLQADRSADAAGTVTEQLLDDDIQLDMNNLWANGFIEADNPGSAAAPSFYGLVGNTDNADTIKAREVMWAYTDRTGAVTSTAAPPEKIPAWNDRLSVSRCVAHPQPASGPASTSTRPAVGR